MLQELRLWKQQVKNTTGIIVTTKYHDDVLNRIEEKVHKGIEEGEQEVEKLRGQDWVTTTARQKMPGPCARAGCKCNNSGTMALWKLNKEGKVEVKTKPLLEEVDVEYQNGRPKYVYKKGKDPTTYVKYQKKRAKYTGSEGLHHASPKMKKPKPPPNPDQSNQPHPRGSRDA